MLTDAHRRDLERFRISTEMLEAAGIRSLTDSETRELLGIHGRHGQDLGGIYFPYHDPLTGQRTGARVRLDHPDDCKYLMEAECRHLFFPPGTPPEWFTDPAVQVVVAEAEKSAMALHAWAKRKDLKMIAVAIGGVSGWRRKIGKVEKPEGGSEYITGPSPDLDLIKWTGRDAIILFDSNANANLMVSAARDRFSKHLRGLGAKVWLAEVPTIAGVNGPDDFIVHATDDEVSDRIFRKAAAVADKKEEAETQAAELVSSVADLATLFHTSDRTGYALVRIKDHAECWPIHSSTFRRFICYTFYEPTKRVPGTQAVLNAIHLLEAKANFEGDEEDVFVRVAERDGEMWLDLANSQWEAVHISKEGWKVVSNPPVHFKRAPGMLPLPYPTKGGKPSDLSRFLNLPPNSAEFLLVLSWLLAAFRSRGPYPILNISGEQGSAKSTVSRVLRMLVDPYKAPLRNTPHDERDLQIAASKSQILAFDNLSKIEPWLSDALCRLATGGGLATRSLYTDSEETIFDSQRPIIVNGIVDLASRGDFIERSLFISMPRIEEEKRVTENEFRKRFDQAQPSLLGALLDVISSALGRIEKVHLAALPRMADFAVWFTACEDELGVEPGRLLELYTANVKDANSLALESSIIVAPLVNFMDTQLDAWEGTAAELLKILKSGVEKEEARAHAWPKSPRALGGALRGLAPNLRKSGLVLKFHRKRHGGDRLILIEKSPKQSPPPPEDIPDTDSIEEDL